jgi:hypothetical protein
MGIMNSPVFKTIGWLIAVTATVPLSYAADPIFSSHISVYGAGVDQIVPAVYFAIGSVSNSVPLFGVYHFTTNDVGRTFIDSQSNDPNFSALVNILTGPHSDANGLVTGYVGQGVPGGTLGPEGGIFTPLPFYLSGYHIDNIELTVNELTIVSPGRDPNHNGRWTDINFDVTLLINSLPIPEPPVGLLSGLFLASTWLVRRLRVHATCHKSEVS